MTSEIKIVPDAEPNADGEWIEVPVDLRHVRRWVNIDALVKPYVPAGFHIVAVDCRRVQGMPLSTTVTTLPKAV
jgi:hypothetical protein